jgi:TRAP-type C4-dicarboxylate transport system substrate-binding protein
MKRLDVRSALLLAAIAMCWSVSATWVPQAVAQPTMKIGLATINDGQHEHAKRFAAAMEKTAPGKLKIEIYPADQLGAAARLIEGLTLGTVEGWIGPPEFLVGQDPRYQIMGAPGLVTDMEHGYRLCKDPALRNALLSLGDQKGIKGIGAIVNGPNFYATRKPFRTLADFKGTKMRVFGSPMHTLAMEKLGATGVPMSPGDALIALGSGAIDGNRTAMSLLVAFKYFDVVKYATQVNGDAMIFSVFVVGKAWFDRLPPDVQKAVLAAGGDVEDDVRVFAMDRQRATERAWRESGAELIQITGPEQAEFVKRMVAVGEEVAANNPRIKESYTLLVDRAKATRQ